MEERAEALRRAGGMVTGCIPTKKPRASNGAERNYCLLAWQPSLIVPALSRLTNVESRHWIKVRS